MGIIAACGPAIRQFVAYCMRTGTPLPSTDRQRPGEDFVKMRRRITIRDILWFRSPDPVSGRVLDAAPIRHMKTPGDVESTAQKSLLNEWPRSLNNKLFQSGTTKSHSNDTSELSLSRGTRNDDQLPLCDQVKEDHPEKHAKDLDLAAARQAANGGGIMQTTFLDDASATRSSNDDSELASALEDPVRARRGDHWRLVQPAQPARRHSPLTDRDVDFNNGRLSALPHT
ncbi:MAG: hypothetical protein M1820_002256 [Bogoriella megaspora]|nr:MAG: hypothetical protein M1820_002256 [Bogoriella megaspora]